MYGARVEYREQETTLHREEVGNMEQEESKRVIQSKRVICYGARGIIRDQDGNIEQERNIQSREYKEEISPR